MTSSILVVTPARVCDPTLAIAAVRAGEIGLLDLGLGIGDETRTRALDRLAHFSAGRPAWGVRWDTLGRTERIPAPLTDRSDRVPYLLVAGLGSDHSLADLRRILKQARKVAEKIFLEVYDASGALAARTLACDGLVLKANEAGGRVAPQSAFVLLQKLHGRLELPYWVQGAWGPDTAAAAYLAGAAGIVLGEELWLARESPLGDRERERMAHLDGSETVCLGDERALFRLFNQVDRKGLAELERHATTGGALWPSALADRWQSGRTDGRGECPQPLGQGIAHAAALARQHRTTGAILQAFRATIAGHLDKLDTQRALAAAGPLAQAVGTRYPVFQGPMTRVSDVAPFCDAVARTGGLPFLALALMRGEETAKLLAKTKEKLGDRPWGVGILGFVPPELRKEQLEVVEACKPRFALIAGGRPSQATQLEKHGISTYLHAPSPGLLENFLEQGARKFILEGRECGGHVGPRSSFLLWQSAIDVLAHTTLKDPENVHVLFAGGIHDALSCAMVQALAVPLVERGIKVGVLMGTAYLFTDEAVDCGAITPNYQDQAVACGDTALLASGVGHATRCARTPFVDEFDERRRALTAEGRSADEIRFELEMLNVGRLRMASKGLARIPPAEAERPDTAGDAAPGAAELLARGARMLKGELTAIDGETQRRDGMYMIGEVATLRDRSLGMAELHETVCDGGTELAVRLAGRELPWREDDSVAARPGEPIAVIGMACMFPESPDLRTYWQNILNRFDAVREVPPDRWKADLYYSSDRLARDKLYSKWGSFLDETRFDPLQYRIPPASVASIDPVQLMLLEVARRALDDAGYGDDRSFPRERTAVIVGTGGVNDVGIGYATRTMLPHYLSLIGRENEPAQQAVIEELREELPEWTEDSFPGILVNVFSGRVANRLDLQGPNFVVDAACASSLAALHTAVGQLRSRSCEMALVGAADGTNSAFAFMSFAKTHALTPGGKIRPFDDRADGIVLGEGVGVTVLKRLADAERDGDRIYAVIRGVGSSSDGRNRSLTAPHPAGQALAFERAYADAGFEPSTVTLIEAHATGTAVGDQSEIAAMRQVFCKENAAETVEPYCAVGSVKSNIGHAKTAAGMAALIKTTLALQHRVLPPTINVETPNKRADFEHSPFWINVDSRPWIDGSKPHPRRAGVSAFGFGGTNFHIAMEEYRGEYRGDCRVGSLADLTPRAAEVFLWERGGHTELIEALRKLKADLAATSAADLGHLASCAHHDESGRSGPGGVRLGIVAISVEDLAAKLDRAIAAAAREESLELNSGVFLSDDAPADPSEVCFLFPGQGSQRPDMFCDLAQFGPFGLDLFEQANHLLRDFLPRPLTSYIYPRPVFDKKERKRLKSEIDDTRVAQPALGLVNIFACDVLARFGLRPAFVGGHSYGEYVALCVAGVSTREDLLLLSAQRGQAVYEAGREHPGGMAAVAASAEETQAALDELDGDAIIANFNGPKQMVIAGSKPSIEAAMKRFPERGLAIRRVAVTAPFHTAAMEGPSRVFAGYLKSVDLRRSRIPIYSNVNARPYPDDIDAIREQLAIHLARPVRFAQQIQAMHRDGARVFIEAGPGRILTSLVQRILEDRPHTAVALDMSGQPGWLRLGHLLARTHAVGLKPALSPWFENRGLESRPTAVYLEQTHKLAQGRPSDWILCPGGARPATAAPAGTAKVRRDRSTMNDKPESPKKEPIDAGASSLLLQLQETMGKWLDLQREQQRLSERFLQIQQRIVGGLLDGQDHAASESLLAELSGLGTDAAAARPAHAPAGLPVAPAPVLPKLQPTGGAPRARPAAPPRPAAAEPAVAAAPATAPQADDDVALPSVETFKRDLIDQVSQRTGYPEEMLELDLPLEAGLGVDSIKTMEIFSSLKAYHGILSEEDQDEEDLLVGLAQLKTLQDIIDQYSRRRAEFASGGKTPSKLPAPPAAETPAPAPEVERLILRSVPAPTSPETDATDRLDFPRDQVMLILGEAPELSSSMEAALETTGHRFFQLTHGSETKRLGARRFQVDLLDLEALRGLADTVRGEDRAPVGGLVNLLGLSESVRRPGLNGKKTPLKLVQALMNVAQVFEDDVQSCSKSGGGYLVNVTTLDGRFGLRGAHALPVAQAGSLGFFKSLAREWRGVRVKNVDLDPKADPRTLIVGLLSELTARDELIEVGLDGEGRWRLSLVEEPASNGETGGNGATRARRGKLPLSKESVVLATGGAHGITAETLKRLADETGVRMVIVGRSELTTPEDEPAELRSIRDETPLRSKLIERMRADGGRVTPAEIEGELRRILKNRAIRDNLEAIRAAGSEVEYHAIDVRDDAAFGGLIDDLYERFGRIDGVVHGAGVIEDSWLREKTAESVARVFETKVNGALLLAKKLRPDGLRFFVMFSSLSGRFGNVGQVDYSAANEVLNKLAAHLNREWPGRVVAINWGPWDSGMLSETLRAAYAERGIQLIPTEAGVRSLLEELCLEETREPEVILTCSAERIVQLGEAAERQLPVGIAPEAR